MDEVLVKFGLPIFFLALRRALLIASEVSPALPRPKPIPPFLSPATSATEKENRRPPATTRVTRRIETIFWSNSGFGRPKDEPRRPPLRSPPLLSPPPATLCVALRAGVFGLLFVVSIIYLPKFFNIISFYLLMLFL